MPKIEIRLPNSEECAKELLQTKKIKTMNNGFEVKSYKKFKWSINMKKRHSTSLINSNLNKRLFSAYQVGKN